MRRSFTFVMVLAAGLALACGTSETQKQAEETAKGAEQATTGLEQMAKGLEQMAGQNENQPPADPVSFRDLQALFPDLDGWEKGSPKGERMTSPVPFSQAEVTYTRGESQINAKIIDTASHQMLLMPYTMFLAAGYEKETDTGYEKSVKVGEHPGWEKWQSDSKDGELNLLVGKRFLVTFDGSHLENTKALYEAAGRTDLASLASLK